MGKRTISQADARRYKRTLEHYEAREQARLNAWTAEFPGGVHIAGEAAVSISTTSAIKTARRLGHAVVAVQDGNAGLQFYALPLANPQ